MASNPNHITDSESFTRRDVKIPSIMSSLYLHAWQFVPKGRKGPHPVLVFAHGFSGNKLQGLAPYATAYAAEGYASVVFDYRRFGGSDGEPRDVVVTKEQQEDYRAVIKYCRQQPEFDPSRVIAWGTSFSGAHVVKLASEKELNLPAAMIQCPALGASPSPPICLATFKTIIYCVLDQIKRGFGLSPLYIPAVAHPGEVGALTAPGVYDSMMACCYEQSDYPNRVSAASALELMKYHISHLASSITCPILIIAPEFDDLCFIERAEQFARDCSTAELVVPQCGHFEIYDGGKGHEESVAAQISFLRKNCPL